MLPRRDSGPTEQNFWISYADLMAGLLFVFILLVGAIVVKEVLMRTDFQAVQADLRRQKAALGHSEAVLARMQRRLHETAEALRAAQVENAQLGRKVARLQRETAELNATLRNTRTRLGQARDSVRDLNASLQLSRTEMRTLKALLLQSQDDLNATRAQCLRLAADRDRARRLHADVAETIRLRDAELARLQKALLLKTQAYTHVVKDLNLTRAKIKNLTGIKVRVVEKLRAKLGDSIAIDAKTGALRFASNILFNQGEATLKPPAKAELSRILGRYIDTLLSDPQIRRHIDLITIEGHTNSDGSYLYNLQLSQRRALAVMEFLYRRFPKNRALFRQYLSAAGRAYAEPVPGPDGKEDKEASRRIEITFRIKNDAAIRELMRYLDAQERHRGP